MSECQLQKYVLKNSDIYLRTVMSALQGVSKPLQGQIDECTVWIQLSSEAFLCIIRIFPGILAVLVKQNVLQDNVSSIIIFI